MKIDRRFLRGTASFIRDTLVTCAAVGAGEIRSAFDRWESLSRQEQRYWIDNAIVYSLKRNQS